MLDMHEIDHGLCRNMIQIKRKRAFSIRQLTPQKKRQTQDECAGTCGGRLVRDYPVSNQHAGLAETNSKSTPESRSTTLKSNGSVVCSPPLDADVLHSNGVRRGRESC